MGQFIEHVRPAYQVLYITILIFHLQYHRTVPFDAYVLSFYCAVSDLILTIPVTHRILGGGRGNVLPVCPLTSHPFTAEDVLGDLGVRQAIRSMPKNARL